MISKNLNIKFLLFITILLNISFPINNLVNFIFFVLFTIIIFFNKIKKFNFFKSKYTFFILTLTLINIFFLKIEKIEEAHSVFITKDDIKIISEFLPKTLINKITADLNKFDYKRYEKGRESSAIGKIFIEKPYAFSSDSLFQKNKYTRQIDKIRFDKRSDHRIGQFNTIPFAMPYDQKLKENFPFYVFYEIPSKYNKSKICGQGNLFYAFSDSSIIKELNFKSFGKFDECIVLPENKNFFYIFGYSIGDFDNLTISLNDNNELKLAQYLKLLILIIIFILIVFEFIEIKINKKIVLISISILSSFLLAYFNDPNVIFGLRHVYGGSDGLIFNSFAIDIIENLKNNKFLLALRGGEDIYYFQPGMRYFLSIFMVVFGETNFGHVLLISFLPYIIFLIFKKITNTNIAYLMFFLFVFFPIFESMGFGQFNYIRQAIRSHAESLSILFICISIYLILFESEKKAAYFSLALISLLLSQAVFLRPNFLPICIILSIFIILQNIKNKEIITKNLFYISLFSTIFFALIHNYYFGNNLTLFSNSSVHILFTKDFASLNFTQANNFLELLLIQLRDWNDLVYFPRLLILIYIIYNINIFRKNDIFFYLILCCISQHIVLLLTHASSRYAYLAWLLTFIIFIKILYEKKFFDKISTFYKKLFISKNI